MDELKRKIEEEANLGLELCKKGKLEEGIEHLRFAAEHNYLEAIVNLGHALKLADQYYEAFEWTLRGAELGDATAMSNLAIMYRRGQGCDCNVDEAVKWGKKIIEKGDIDGGYQEIICSYLYAVDNYQRDFEKAFEYALEGSKKVMAKNPNPKRGDVCESVIQLALCYNFAKGCKKDEKEALKYYQYCSKCGMPLAMYNAACIYGYSEDESLRDIDKSIKLFQHAANLDYGDAFYELGYLYHLGEKVEKDLILAKRYYAHAIRLGNGESHNEDAITNLKEIDPEFTDKVVSGKYVSLID